MSANNLDTLLAAVSSLAASVSSLKLDQEKLLGKIETYQLENRDEIRRLQQIPPLIIENSISSPRIKQRDGYKVHASDGYADSDSDSDARSVGGSQFGTSPSMRNFSTSPASSVPGFNSGASNKIYTSRVVLTTYPGQVGINPVALNWGAPTASLRGPIVASRIQGSLKRRNAIGAHGGSYSIYRALAVAIHDLDPNHRPNLRNTEPVFPFGPHPQWFDPTKIVSMDPWGHVVSSVYAKELADGLDVRPTIAITKAHMRVPEIENKVKEGKLSVDGKIVVSSEGELMVTKGAVEPVWYLPGVASRFGVEETVLRRCLFEDTGGMYPELITRTDLKVFLPPIGGLSIYILGDPADISNPNKALTLRIHDECNGSDVFGSDICTCRPYLIYGIEECVRAAQTGGVGLIVYFRKEGRALGEVTKYLVYNARKRAEGGDTAAAYFQRTENIAGVKDMRFQAIMPDVLHWMGVTKIQRMISMSNM
ncbi:Uracil-regulated protein 1, partial [Nowakowskiella sp. JEL0078]